MLRPRLLTECFHRVIRFDREQEEEQQQQRRAALQGAGSSIVVIIIIISSSSSTFLGALLLLLLLLPPLTVKILLGPAAAFTYSMANVKLGSKGFFIDVGSDDDDDDSEGTEESYVTAESLNEEGNKLMSANTPMEAIAKLVRARGNQALCERRGIHLP